MTSQLTAFFFSGRFSVTSRTGPSLSTITAGDDTTPPPARGRVFIAAPAARRSRPRSDREGPPLAGQGTAPPHPAPRGPRAREAPARAGDPEPRPHRRGERPRGPWARAGRSAETAAAAPPAEPARRPRKARS